MQPIKKCSRCGKEKSISNFQKDRSKTDGVRNECKPCTSKRRKETLSKDTIRKHNLEKNFGKGALDVYAGLFEKQGGVCSICKKAENGRYKHLCIDHDHITGDIRGLLCSGCNRGLGFFLDNYSLLRNAAKYLQDHSERKLIWSECIEHHN